MKNKVLALLMAAGMMLMMTAIPAAAAVTGDHPSITTGPNKVSPIHNPETEYHPPKDPNSPVTDDMTMNPAIPITVSVVCAGMAGVVYLSGRKHEE